MGRTNLPGELLQRGYRLLSLVGRGSTSEVYEARDSESGRTVAIKVSLGNIQEAERVANRLHTAWNVGRGLRHPHLVATLDGGRLSDGRAFLVMESLSGRDLQWDLDEHEPIPPARAIHVVRQVSEALVVLHGRGAIHRDVKPENIFLCDTGRFQDHVKLIDMGVLSLRDDDPQRAHEVTGAVLMGTPLYLAPELARGLRPTPKADIYALGAVLYHLLAGVPPFDGEDPGAVIERHLREEVPELPDELELPPELRELVRQCLAKDPADRPESAALVVATLDRCQMAMANDSVEILAPRAGRVPAVPVVGAPAEWRQFASDLGRNVLVVWSQPPKDLAGAIEWVRAAQDAVEVADAHATDQRARADEAARGRIEARTRLEQQLGVLHAELEDERQALREASDKVDAAAAARDELDERYRGAVARLRAEGSGTLDSVNPATVVPVVAQVRELLAMRNELEQALTNARNAERDAAEAVALTLAEESEVRRALVDVEQAENDEGRRMELLAARMMDRVITAQRAFENACLNLYSQYVKRGHAMTGAPLESAPTIPDA